MLVLMQEPAQEGWKLFAKVQFKSVFFKAQNEYFLVPAFDAAMRSKQGIEIQIKGHYMPVELKNNSLVLSKFPYASCFFCGGAGPESVAEVKLKNKLPKLKADQVITVKGILKLNDNNVNHLNFILEEAEIL